MVFIDKEKCTGCGSCISECVGNKIELVDKKAEIKSPCIQCGHCLAICPNEAVSIPDYDMEDVEALKPENKLDPELLLRCIKARRSIRDYKEDKISEENIKLMVQAGRYTATAVNGQFHKYIFVQDNMDKLKDMVWKAIEAASDQDSKQGLDYGPYKELLKRKKENDKDDFLFRNAPAVLFITSERLLDAGMAAENIEMMAVSLGMGAMFNGFLLRAANDNTELKKWLGIDNDTICACLLLGYPKKKYIRTAPRKKADFKIL